MSAWKQSSSVQLTSQSEHEPQGFDAQNNSLFSTTDSNQAALDAMTDSQDALTSESIAELDPYLAQRIGDTRLCAEAAHQRGTTEGLQVVPSPHMDHFTWHLDGLDTLDTSLEGCVLDVEDALHEGNEAEVNTLLGVAEDLTDRLGVSYAIVEAEVEMYDLLRLNGIQELSKGVGALVTGLAIASKNSQSLLTLRAVAEQKEILQSAMQEGLEAAAQTAVQAAIMSLEASLTTALRAAGPAGWLAAFVAHQHLGAASDWVDEQLGTEPHALAEGLRGTAAELSGESSYWADAAKDAGLNVPGADVLGKVSDITTVLDGVVEMGTAAEKAYRASVRLQELMPQVPGAIQELNEAAQSAGELVPMIEQLEAELGARIEDAELWGAIITDLDTLYGDSLYAI